MKWHKIYLRKMTEEEKEFYQGDYDEIWDGTLPDIDEEVLVTYPLSSGEFVDTYKDTWLDFEIGLGFENTESDVVYWMQIPQYNGELGGLKMTNEELKQEIERLEEQIKGLKAKLEEKSFLPYQPYEVEVPDELEDYFYLDETGCINRLQVYDEEDQIEVFKRGLAFKTREEAEQFDKERILINKLKKWAEEHNEGWYPIWENGDDKFSIYYFHNSENFSVCEDWNCNTFSKFPYFKLRELAEQFIEEFGEEIKEVLC